MIEINGLSFNYTKKPFTEDITFNVERSEIFGFLGPFGAA